MAFSMAPKDHFHSSADRALIYFYDEHVIPQSVSDT